MVWMLIICFRAFSRDLFKSFMIGIIHGIGVETPTQIMVITSAVGLGMFIIYGI